MSDAGKRWETIGDNELEWVELDRRHTWHPRIQGLTSPPPLPIVAASGTWLTTADGERLLDVTASGWVTLHGHGQPEILEAIARQGARLDHVAFTGLSHEPASRLATKLSELLPADLSRVIFSDDGATAVEIALKMCVQSWANEGETRTAFLALEGAHHGDTFGAMSVSERTVFTTCFRRLMFDVTHLTFPETPAEEEEMVADAARILHEGRIAGVIVEPMIQGAGGMRTWSARALGRLADLAGEYNVPLIADEGLTAFGRTGRMFAIEHAGIVPDIVCLSKTLAGGMLPMAATVCRGRMYAAFLSRDPFKSFFHGHSFCASPIACAAALANLELVENGQTLERIAAIERIHEEGMEMLRRHPHLARHRVLGAIAAVDVVAHDAQALDRSVQEVVAHARANGVLLSPIGSTIYLLPPYCITDAELEHAYGVIDEALA